MQCNFSEHPRRVFHLGGSPSRGGVEHHYCFYHGYYCYYHCYRYCFYYCYNYCYCYQHYDCYHYCCYWAPQVCQRTPGDLWGSHQIKNCGAALLHSSRRRGAPLQGVVAQKGTGGHFKSLNLQ